MRQELIGKRVVHKTFGQGSIIQLNDSVLKVQFSEREIRFSYPGAFKDGFLVFEDSSMNEQITTWPEEKPKSPISIQPVVFMNIAWMKWYLGTTEDDIPINGGSYVREEQDCSERINFRPFTVVFDGEDKETDCFLATYEPKSNRGQTNQTHIERIRGCAAMKNRNCVSDVTVVWCATAPNGNSYVVGWYKNATVYRDFQSAIIDKPDGTCWDCYYNVTCAYEDATLIPYEKRESQEWKIPRRNTKERARFGFGQANIWYASEEEAKPFVSELLKRIEYYSGENDVPIIVK